LEGRRRIRKSKEHHRWFKQSLVCDEGCLPFISLLYSHIIVPPTNVELHEEGTRAYFVDQLRNEWEGVAISDGPLVDSSIVLDRAKFSVFLFDEKEGGGVRAFGWTNVTFLHVLLYELLQFLLFELGEGVDLPGYSAQGVGFEFDGMVPDSWFWEVLRSLFAEDFMVTLVANWYGVLGSILSRGTWPFDSCYEN
jgi:hypothetical protein